MGASDVEVASDGFLITEFVMIERMYETISTEGSTDPWTCSLGTPGKPVIPAIGISDSMLECLDIGSASTLGGLVGGMVVDNLEFPSEQDGAHLFGADTTCNGKTVSDGVINAYDFAVIMWAQFHVGPYASVDFSSQVTVQGREGTGERCGNGQSQPDYMLALADDFCAAGVESQRRLSAVSDSTRAAPRDLQASVVSWAIIPEIGEWTRIRFLHGNTGQASTAAIAMELFLLGVGGAITQDLTVEAPPKGNCSDTSCAPARTDTVTVSFRRHLEDFSSPDTVFNCAYIQRGAANALRGGTLAITQSDPLKACHYDVFVFVPHTIRSQLGAEQCGGQLGVRAGSTALDGLGGATQLATVCATAAEPPSPPPPPMGSRVSLDILLAGSVNDYTESILESIRRSVATTAHVGLSAVSVSVVSGSVRLLVTISTTGLPVDEVIANVADGMGSTADASAVLGMPVLQTPAITWSAPSGTERYAPPERLIPPEPQEGLPEVDGVAADKSDTDAVLIGLIIGGVASPFLLAIAYACRRLAQRLAHDLQLQKGNRTADEWQVDRSIPQNAHSGLAPAAPHERFERARQHNSAAHLAASTSGPCVIVDVPEADTIVSSHEPRPVLLRTSSANGGGSYRNVMLQRSASRVAPDDMLPGGLIRRRSSQDVVDSFISKGSLLNVQFQV